MDDQPALGAERGECLDGLDCADLVIDPLEVNDACFRGRRGEQFGGICDPVAVYSYGRGRPTFCPLPNSGMLCGAQNRVRPSDRGSKAGGGN
jgi:hypothetical protein